MRAAAQYLLRFDDLCPTVSREGWRRCRAVIDEFQIQPILAIVPDNRDPELQAAPPDAEFWHQMQGMERAGAMIGLHGYRHLCANHGRSLVPIHRASEFAGLPAETQRAWIREGLRVLRDRGLDPKIWVAPRHGFDRNTLRALRSEGIQLVSDGFARRPFLRGGFVWIPQQLWAPLEKPDGLWTICVHPNSASEMQIAALRGFLRGHAPQFTSVDRMLAGSPLSELTVAERIDEKLALLRLRAARTKRRLRDGLRKGVVIHS
jgi:hypothetical protein